MVMSPVAAELVGLASKPRFTIHLWDFALMDETDPPMVFQTAFDTGVNAITCFRELAGLPEGEPLQWEGDESEGYILSGSWRSAKYRFVPLILT